MGGPSTPSNTTQNVIQTQQLPQWYSDYLQTTIGRALSQASGEAPVYGGPRIAGLTGDQNQSFEGIRSLQGAGSGALDQGGNFLSQMARNNPNLSASPYFNQASDMMGQTFANVQPYYTQAGNMVGSSIANAGQAFGTGADLIARGASQDITGSVSPFLQQGQNLIGQGQQNVVGLASPYVQQSTRPTGMMAAQPYLNAANQSLGSATNEALNPYLSGAMNALSDQAAYDLKNKYLPAVNDDFIRAGQFGSTRNQDITAQTIRDLSNTVQQNQAGLINQAYGQAQSAAGQNLALKGSLGQTAGGLGTQQQQIQQSAGLGLGNLGGTQGSLAIQGAGAAGNLGQLAGTAATNQGQLGIGAGSALGNIGSAQGQLGISGASTLGSLANSQGQLGMQGAGLLSNMGSQAGSLSNAFNQSLGQGAQTWGNLGTMASNNGLNQTNALYAAGQAQQGQQQRNLDTAYNDWLNQTFYPQNQTSWLSSIVRGLPSNPAGYGQQTQTQVPSNTGAQVAGLLGAGAGLVGGVQGGSGGSGGYGGYYKKGGAVKKAYRNGGRVRGIGALHAGA